MICPLSDKQVIPSGNGHNAKKQDQMNRGKLKTDFGELHAKTS